ncbi:hypothetical protein ABNF97_21485 [Plantactinospora sp. B6F1]
MNQRPGILRTIASGLVGGVAFVTGLFLTFAQFGGAGEGETGLLYDPDTQSAKLIAVWKEIEPLPFTIENPAPILGGYVVFAVCFAFLYRSVSPAWPAGLRHRIPRLAAIIWLLGAFFEFQGPVNLFHQPPRPLLVALTFWAVSATITAAAISAVAEAGAGSRRAAAASAIGAGQG